MRSFFWPGKTLPGILALLLGMLLPRSSSYADPSKYPQFAQQSPPANVALVSVDDLAKDIQAGKKPLIIDVRSEEEYREVHIVGAVSRPLTDFDSNVERIPKDQLVILYWACPHHLASLAYGILYERGYRNMKVLDEGIVGWYQKRYPVEGTKVP
jgi:rhodanese-related sulfurtransferase